MTKRINLEEQRQPFPMDGTPDSGSGGFEILCITAGNGNGWEFPADVLRAAVPLFDGVQCFIDHLPLDSVDGHSVRDAAGMITEPVFDESVQGIRAHLIPFGPSADLLRETCNEILNMDGMESKIGFSADLGFNCEGNVVTEIVKIYSVDLVVAAQSLLLGSSENAIPVENTLTGQKIALSYDVDRNFNGAFDDADDKVHYDFRYAVLVSDSTFSCGNLFASVMKDHGVLILGERSGGGTCAIQNMATADGFMYRISSGRMRLINEAGEALEEGIAPDVDLVSADSSGKKDFRAFCDIDRMSEEIAAWYD